MDAQDGPRDLADLVRESRDGDDGATEELYARVHLIAHRYARARLGTYPASEETAADVAQEVCMAVMTALPRYDERGLPFEAFVYRIASHKVADAQRGYARAPIVTGDDTERLDAPTDSAESIVVRDEEAARAWALLDDLSPKVREIMILRVAVGLSAKETADAMEMTPGAVRVAQHRGLQALRTAWGKEERTAWGKEES